MLHQFLPLRRTNTLVIGAGPTGLATSYLLKKQGIEHLLLEQSQVVASSWRILWDNYKLAMTAGNVDMPGANLSDHVHQAKHPSRDEMVAFFEWYTKHHALPIQFQTCVLSINKQSDGIFEVKTNQATYHCDSVVCCIGPRHHPKYPFDIQELKAQASMQIMHSSEYRSSKTFAKEGKVLVVGSGAGALSIAYDIQQQGYPVELACGRTNLEILDANKHLYETSDREVVPSLDFLMQQGLPNHGRLEKMTENQLVFNQAGIIEEVACHTYTTLIFATGFERSFKLLKDLLPSSVVDYNNEVSGIEGLYIAGIPGPHEQTVIISQGSQHARTIVEQITACQKVTMPRANVAKY